MKKQLLILTAILCATPTFAKVTYEDAVASSAAFHEHNNAVSKGPNSEGLGAGELQENAANQMGKWVKLPRKPFDVASFVLLTGDSSAYDCAGIGIYGAQNYEECIHVGNGDFRCTTYTNYYICE